MPVRWQIDVSGIVQGVGFRPFIYRLARTHQLTGHIRNTAAGVSLEVQGAPENLDRFVGAIRSEAPRAAHVVDLETRSIPLAEDSGFRIVDSERGPVHTLISPDIATCNDCLRELFDSADRRYRYPFINCTNCGPRFTIAKQIPYDRATTSMAAFRMCPLCQAEYDDPGDRRFHAQPNACAVCGPHVELWDRSGGMVAGDPIQTAIEALGKGLVVAVKGLGGFHLAVDALNAEAVQLLRARKRRVEKPFALMVRDIESACRFCELTDAARDALESSQRPIVLLPRRQDGPVPSEVSPRVRDLGVFLAYTPLHHLLLRGGEFPALVMTSGNLSEEPIAIGNQEAVERLGSLADLLLVHNRDILLRCDDSVVRPVGGSIRQLRRSRGFVPVPVFLRNEQPALLAVGGELKNTICLTKGKHAFLSQHVGDLENVEGYKFFAEAITHLQGILEIKPEAIAYDLHPGYFSTRWAQQQTGIRLVGVQHHHAHIASCMAENHLEGRVIGIALDGTGYGTDGKIWGGEVLVAGYAGFERRAHLDYVAMPGGEAAVRQPWRMAVSYLAHYFGRDFWSLPSSFVRRLEVAKAETLLRMIERQVNCQLTSSCGRLFDAVSALAGLRDEVSYEAQAAIELEMAIQGDEGDAGDYEFELMEQNQIGIIQSRKVFEALLGDIQAGVPTAVLSRRFHKGLIRALTQVVYALRNQTGLNRVCLSGGTFNNVFLFEGLARSLEEVGLEVFSHREVPAGDGGLSLGQALVAAQVIGS